MSEEKNNNLQGDVKPVKAAGQTAAGFGYGKDNRGARNTKGFRKDRRTEEVKDEFEQKIIDIARVTRVMAGGKRMRFRACVVIGNRDKKVGIGLAKGADVSMAVSKAVNKARKNIIDVPIINNTIPHEVYNKFGAAKVLLKPAKEGRGIIAGGAVRAVVELAGIKNIVSKILGTNNKINNVKCTIKALQALKPVRIVEKKVEKKKEEVKEAVIENSK